jgi:hypothetical protein
MSCPDEYGYTEWGIEKIDYQLSEQNRLKERDRGDRLK